MPLSRLRETKNPLKVKFAVWSFPVYVGSVKPGIINSQGGLGGRFGGRDVQHSFYSSSFFFFLSRAQAKRTVFYYCLPWPENRIFFLAHSNWNTALWGSWFMNKVVVLALYHMQAPRLPSYSCSPRKSRLYIPECGKHPWHQSCFCILNAICFFSSCTFLDRGISLYSLCPPKCI